MAVKEEEEDLLLKMYLFNCTISIDLWKLHLSE